MPDRLDRHLRRPLGRRRTATRSSSWPAARHVSNDHDLNGERRGYKGISIPKAQRATVSAAASWRWTSPSTAPTAARSTRTCRPPRSSAGQPFVDEIVRACLDEKIETGRIDFVDDLANIVPAVLTLAMLGIPLKNWDDLQRAGARLGVHPAALARHRARRRDAPADGHRHGQPDDRRSGRTRGPG